MKQVIFTAILILAFCFAAFAQDAREIADPARYDKIDWREEKPRLLSFLVYLSENKNSEGILVLEFDKKSSRKAKIRRLKRIVQFIDSKQFDRKQILFRISEGDSETTTYWIIENNKPTYLKEEDETHKIIKAEEFEKKIKELFPKK
jgi:hypothetical protein